MKMYPLASKAKLLASIAFACGLAVVISTPAYAVEIGGVVGLVPNAFGAPPQQDARVLQRGSEVVSGERVETLQNASIHIQFLDGTDLRMGAASTIILDHLIYDPNTSAGELFFEITVGVARFVSGDIDQDDFRVKTPTAVIGIRGTDFVVDVAPNGTSRVAVIEGSVIVTPLGGPPAVVGVGRTAVVAANRTQQPALIEVGINVDEDPGLGSIEPSDSETESGSGDSQGASFQDVPAPNPAEMIPQITPAPPRPSQPMPSFHNY